MSAHATVRTGVRAGEIASYTVQGLSALEAALTSDPLNAWESLLDADPCATLFQSPVWCMPWYRSYLDFEPLVLVVTSGSELAGVVPLAIENATGRLTFAGDNMTDYRDVVTRPEWRREVVGEFLQLYRSRGGSGVFHFGSTLPESETPGVLLSMAGACGLRTVARQHYGWRWWPYEQTEDPLRRKSVRYPLNYFRRQGELTAERVVTDEQWERFKRDFYVQHSLRQIFAGRPVSFDSPQKREFLERVFRSRYGHVTALWLNGELIAGHVGSVYKRVLYWGAPSFDVRYRQYSPNLVLLVLTMKNAAEWGFDGIDLTIGKGDLKERFSTSRVDLPWIELYARQHAYFLRKGRIALAGAGRAVAQRIRGENAWEKRFKPFAARIAHKASRAREMGLAGAILHTAKLGVAKFGEHTRGIVFMARPEDVREISAALQAGEICEYHDNELRDLAKRDVWNDSVAREIATKVRSFTDIVRVGRTLHTVVVNDRLAGWGLSYWPTEPARLTEVGNARLEYPPDSVSLYDFYTLPEFRGRRLYQSLLTYILRKRFREGAKQAYITVLERNVASRKAIERVGFRPVCINEFTRFLRWKKLRSHSC
ncbi:MAG TPA: GNAT family N-acetyltransferase [Bryobacteraceae bacterium]|nr:GNAT family N-acetyltransferase [Bryobacteraceae bacterium]